MRKGVLLAKLRFVNRTKAGLNPNLLNDSRPPFVDIMEISILIIGSLLWDPEAKRESWRQSRLQLERSVRVEVPIRYARKSRSRGNTYTMTFAEDGLLGQGVLAPCRAGVSDIGDLVSEAEELWRAELKGDERTGIGSSWGCVGVMFGEKALQCLGLYWMEHFRDRAIPISPVDIHGRLNISWPNISSHGQPHPEIILATATKGETSVPTSEQVAEAWINRGHEEYFFENVKRGIRTPDDRLIWRTIKEAEPRWLTESTYSDAVEILEKEAQACA